MKVFDEYGNYRGEIDENNGGSGYGGAGCIILPIIIINALVFFFQSLANYAEYSFPYNAIAFFYFLTICVPLMILLLPLSLIIIGELTPYPNLNIVIILVAAICWFFILYKRFMAFKTFYQKKLSKYVEDYWWTYFIPIVFGLVWFLISGFISFLFTK